MGVALAEIESILAHSGLALPAVIEQQIRDIDDDIHRQLKAMPVWQEKAKLLEEVKGLGVR